MIQHIIKLFIQFNSLILDDKKKQNDLFNLINQLKMIKKYELSY